MKTNAENGMWLKDETIKIHIELVIFLIHYAGWDKICTPSGLCL